MRKMAELVVFLATVLLSAGAGAQTGTASLDLRSRVQVPGIRDHSWSGAEGCADCWETSGKAARATLEAGEAVDPIWNGAAIGGAVGAGIGLLLTVPGCEDDFLGCDPAVIVFGTALFTAAGVGVGALIDASMSVAPIIAKERQGAVLSVTW